MSFRLYVATDEMQSYVSAIAQPMMQLSGVYNRPS